MGYFGKNNTDKLKSLSKEKLDGLDEWQDEFDNLLEGQRKKYLLSSAFIVVCKHFQSIYAVRQYG